MVGETVQIRRVLHSALLTCFRFSVSVVLRLDPRTLEQKTLVLWLVANNHSIFPIS